MTLTKTQLIKEFEKCYWMKSDLMRICKQLNLSATGSKFELSKKIINFIKGKKKITIKKSIIPKRRPSKITLNTKLKEGCRS